MRHRKNRPFNNRSTSKITIGSGMECTVFNPSISASYHRDNRDILRNNRETWSRRVLGGAMVRTEACILNRVIQSLLFLSHFFPFLSCSVSSVFSFRICENISSSCRRCLHAAPCHYSMMMGTSASTVTHLWRLVSACLATF